MSLDKLNRLNKNNTPSYTSTERTKTTSAAWSPPTPLPNEKESILNKESYLLGRIKSLEDEIYLLKTDMLTMLDILSNKIEDKHSARSVREYYSDFRSDEQHILRRIVNKTEAIKNNELNFNGESTETTV